MTVVSGQHSVGPAVCRLDILKKSDREGFSFGLEVLTARLRARLVCLVLITSFPESGFEELQLISLSQRVLASCTKFERTHCLLEGCWCDPGFR